MARQYCIAIRKDEIKAEKDTRRDDIQDEEKIKKSTMKIYFLTTIVCILTIFGSKMILLNAFIYAIFLRSCFFDRWSRV